MNDKRSKRSARRRQVELVDQATIPTKSDHDTLVVHARIRNAGTGPWRDVLFASSNMGGRFDVHDLQKVVDELHAWASEIGRPTEFVLAFQEGGDQPWLPAALRDLGLRYLGGHHPGEASTPMAVSRGIEVLHDRWDQVQGPANVGPGAGPSRSKAKGFRRTRLRLGDVVFGASSFHEYASIMRRWRWVILLAGPIVHWIITRGFPFFLIGDSNSDDDQALIPWLLKRGMTTNHRVLGEIPTHGNRSIDVVAVAARWLRGGRGR